MQTHKVYRRIARPQGSPPTRVYIPPPYAAIKVVDMPHRVMTMRPHATYIYSTTHLIQYFHRVSKTHQHKRPFPVPDIATMQPKQNSLRFQINRNAQHPGSHRDASLDTEVSIGAFSPSCFFCGHRRDAFPGHHRDASRTAHKGVLYNISVCFIGSLKAGFVTERSELGSCRAFRFQYPVLNWALYLSTKTASAKVSRRIPAHRRDASRTARPRCLSGHGGLVLAAQPAVGALRGTALFSETNTP